MVFLVRALALEDDVARQTVFDDEAELALVNHILLRSEVNEYLLGKILFLVVVHRHWRDAKSSRYHTKRQRLAFKNTLNVGQLNQKRLTPDMLNSKTSGSSTFFRFSSSHSVCVYLLRGIFFGNLT